MKSSLVGDFAERRKFHGVFSDAAKVVVDGTDTALCGLLLGIGYDRA